MFVCMPFEYAVNNNRVSSEKFALCGGLHKLLHSSDTYCDTLKHTTHHAMLYMPMERIV